MTTVDSISRARRRKRLSVAEVARRSGLQASNLSAIESGSREPTARNLERAARGTGVHILVADLGGRPPVTEIADAIARFAAAGDEWGQARVTVQLSNDLVSADPFTKVLMVAEPPRALGSKWDSVLAGVVEWRLATAGLPVPDWAARVEGDPQARWSIWPGAVHAIADEVPEPLLRRGVWLGAGELESV
ncbi:helix-turn-helix transcriptional regulator [Herbiconiux sp.]|uniref:helix-turn-helix domain-containing protein n=1 Tax=Herbiconiux sp. TaxID=1871186 RepID=UPI0025BDA978|nr:helix-turn-helix transcriptional regulator [Herbiconiux sp.]